MPMFSIIYIKMKKMAKFNLKVNFFPDFLKKEEALSFFFKIKAKKCIIFKIFERLMLVLNKSIVFLN